MYRADRDEQQVALELRRIIFVEGQGVPLERDLDGLDDRAWHYIARREATNTPVGVARVRLVNEGETGKIERVGVLPEARGLGVSKLIMKSALYDLTTEGALEAKLEAQTHAQGLYEKLGFVAEGGIFYDANMPHVRMTKPLG